jgi:hypothetical protein
MLWIWRRISRWYLKARPCSPMTLIGLCLILLPIVCMCTLLAWCYALERGATAPAPFINVVMVLVRTWSTPSVQLVQWVVVGVGLLLFSIGLWKR